MICLPRAAVGVEAVQADRQPPRAACLRRPGPRCARDVTAALDARHPGRGRSDRLGQGVCPAEARRCGQTIRRHVWLRPVQLPDQRKQLRIRRLMNGGGGPQGLDLPANLVLGGSEPRLGGLEHGRGPMQFAHGAGHSVEPIAVTRHVYLLGFRPLQRGEGAVSVRRRWISPNRAQVFGAVYDLECLKPAAGERSACVSTLLHVHES